MLNTSDPEWAEVLLRRLAWFDYFMIHWQKNISFFLIYLEHEKTFKQDIVCCWRIHIALFYVSLSLIYVTIVFLFCILKILLLKKMLKSCQRNKIDVFACQSFVYPCLFITCKFFFFYIVGLHKFGNPWFLYHIKKG